MLQFLVHLKESQKLKYLNGDSTNPKHCFRAITTGVFKRLAKLTAVNKSNENAKLKDLYPKHQKALQNANLTVPDTTLKEQLIFNNKPRKERDKDS